MMSTVLPSHAGALQLVLCAVAVGVACFLVDPEESEVSYQLSIQYCCIDLRRDTEAWRLLECLQKLLKFVQNYTSE